MSLTKRDFLKISAAGLAVLPQALFAQTALPSLRASVTDLQLLPHSH